VEIIVYDKAKYHFDGDFPDGLSEHQACVHAGMFLAWLVEKDMLSAQLRTDFGGDLARCIKREAKPGETYSILGGALVSDMLSTEGNAFAAAYFDFERGQYLKDYGKLLASGLASIYHVEDSWENYEKIKGRIQRRYEEWRQSKL